MIHIKEMVAMEEYGQRNKIIKVILFVIFILFSQIVSSHVEDSTILIQGYYCTVYKKSEQVDYYKQLLRAKMGLSFSHPIDFYTNRFFLPISIDSLESNLDRINEYESQQKNTMYFFPLNNEHKVLEKTGVKCEKSIQTKLLLDFAIKNSPFYILENDTIHLYKFTYIECLAIEKPISFFDNMWGRLFLSDYIDYNRSVKTIYIITEVDDCLPVFLNNKRINIWIPEIFYSINHRGDRFESMDG